MRQRNSRNPDRGDTTLTHVARRIDGRWFTSAMADRRISQRKLAKLMGVDPASIHRLLTGKRAMRMDEATNLSRLLGVPVADVLTHAGMDVAAGAREVPVVGYVDGAGEVHLELEGRDRVMAPPDLPANAAAVVARTDGSPLDYMDGWVIFFPMPRENGVPPDIIGRYSIVQLESGVKLLRYVRRGYKKGTYNLQANVAPRVESVPLAWASPVLYIRT